jgi:uncharacterized tellurite resistance protein B-like protein
MFLHHLDEEEKKVFLQIARHFVEVDGFFSEEEKDLFERFSREMGILPDAWMTGNLDRETRHVLYGRFSGRKSQASALLELIGLGHADGDYSLPEREMIAEMAEAMGFEKAQIEAMEAWVKTSLMHYVQAEEFWEEG